MGKSIRITHIPSGEVLADGSVGWDITPFEGNYYVREKSLVTEGFRVNYLPGLCFYKFLYVWLDFVGLDGKVERNLGWKYWLPNPLLPFIWFRVGIPGHHAAIEVVEYTEEDVSALADDVRSYAE